MVQTNAGSTSLKPVFSKNEKDMRGQNFQNQNKPNKARKQDLDQGYVTVFTLGYHSYTLLG